MISALDVACPVSGCKASPGKNCIDVGGSLPPWKSRRTDNPDEIFFNYHVERYVVFEQKHIEDTMIAREKARTLLEALSAWWHGHVISTPDIYMSWEKPLAEVYHQLREKGVVK